MPLVVATLSDALREVFTGFPESASAAAEQIAGAYGDYAGGAIAGPTAPVSVAVDAAVPRLSAAVANAFTGSGPAGAAAVAAALDIAFVAFWLGPPPMPFLPSAGPPTPAGVVTLAPPGVLSTALAGVLTAGVATRATADAQASAIAAALDVWTRTVMVTNTPPGPPPVPLA
jgi:hypothetical protein